MAIFSMVLSLLSGVALFLFGMSLMGDGLKLVAGNKLEAFLYRMTNTPLKGVALGTAVTSIIQSSSATTVMVIGFVNSGMMKLKQAIGIIMGANIGTSITGWPKSSLFLLFMPIFHRIFFTGNAAIRRRMVFLLKIPISFSSVELYQK